MPSENKDESAAGCMFVIGLLIVAITVGHFETAAGWLCLGLGMMLGAALSR